MNVYVVNVYVDVTVTQCIVLPARKLQRQRGNLFKVLVPETDGNDDQYIVS